MKKFLLSTLLVLGATFGSNAQIDGGTMMAGGNAYFNYYTYKGYSSTSVSIAPQFGLAFADNFVAGAWFGMNRINDINNWSVAPFLRYYMNGFFVQAGYGYAKFGGTGMSILDGELGYAMFLNDNVALEPAFYVNQYFNNGAAGTDLGFKMGLQVYFNR